LNKEKILSNICPIKDCGRPTHKESKYCIFHASAEEKTERDFKRKLREHVKKIKKDGDDYNFEKFIFIGDIDFKKDLNITVFENVNFRKTIFNGLATFKEVSFKAGAYFTWTIFNGPSCFFNSIFEAGANFTGAIFKKVAFFSDANFEAATKFTGATFKENAYFTFATFKGYAAFDETNFEGDVSFDIIKLLTYLDFNRTKVFPGKKLSIYVNNGKNNIYFQGAYLENACLNFELCEDIFIDFTDALLKNTKIVKSRIENHILQEKEKEFSKAKEIYLILKNNFHSIGRYDDESWAFKKEKDMDRLSQSFPYYKADLKNKGKKEKHPFLQWIQKGNFKNWIISAFWNMIYGYGERPGSVVKTSVVIIILFALSFSLIGIGKPEIIELKGTGIYQNSGNIVDLAIKGFSENSEIRNFPDSLYFSLITFTTLGYGDFRPLEGLGRFLAGSEAFIGALMMALFVYTFARRTGGR